MSVAPPGANGTMSVIGRVGNCSCCATASTLGRRNNANTADVSARALPPTFAFMTPFLQPIAMGTREVARARISLALSVPVCRRNPVGRGSYCSENAPRSERRLVYLGADRGKGITDCVGDRGGRRDRAALAHPLHAIFSERRRGFRMSHFDLGHLRRTW